MRRAFVNILSATVSDTARFYESLLGMTRHFDSEWFVILTHPDIEGLEYGVLQHDHPTVPPELRQSPAGMIVTFVIDDCNKAYERARAMNAQIVQAPTDMPYGQRRLLVKDPDGTVLDISSPTASLQ